MCVRAHAQVELSGTRLAAAATNNSFSMTLPRLEVGSGRDYQLSVFVTTPAGQRSGVSDHIVFYVWPAHEWVHDVHLPMGHGLSAAGIYMYVLV